MAAKQITYSEEARGAILKGVPLGRLGTKQDVANLCMFLGSEFASYLTGAVIPVDGAWSLTLSGTALDPMLDMAAKNRE